MDNKEILEIEKTNDEKEIIRLRKQLERIKEICEEGIPDCPMDETEQDNI